MPRGKSRDKMAEQSEDINRDLCVLVCLETSNGSRNRAVKFSGKKEALVPAIKSCFSDILASDAELILQIRDDSWGADVFVDLIEQNVPDRAVIKVLQKQKEYKQVQWICSRYILKKKMVLGGGASGEKNGEKSTTVAVVKTESCIKM